MDVFHQFGLLGKYVLEGAHSRELAGSDRPELGLPGQAFLDIAGELTAHDADKVVLEEPVLVVTDRDEIGEIRARDLDGGLEWLSPPTKKNEMHRRARNGVSRLHGIAIDDGGKGAGLGG